MRNKSTIVLLFGIFGLLMLGLPDNASTSDISDTEIVIIGNKKLPFDTLSTDELKDIFQRKKTMWEEGEKINFAILISGKTHRNFVRHYIQKTPAQYHRYFKKLVFSGRGVPPMSFRNERSLMAHVALTKGSIGYISSKTRPSGVKIITLVEKTIKKAEEVPEPDEASVTSPEKSEKKEIEGKKTKTLFNNLFD
jgi:ABC-type phosphate transport system substrate-binding protein